MAGFLYITEYAQLTQLVGDAGQMPDENTKLAEQCITVPSTSAALNPGTKYVRLHTDGGAATGVCIEIGFGTVGTPPVPVAVIGNGTVGSQRFAANQTEYKGVPTNGNGSGNAQIQVKIACSAATQ